MNNTKIAFRNSVKFLNNIIAPLAIVTVLKDFKEAIYLIIDRPYISISSLVFFSGLFLYNLRKASRNENTIQDLQKTKETIDNKPAEKKEVKTNKFSLITKLIAGSGLIIILGLVYVSLFVGVHYPLISSSKSKEKVIKQVDEINRYLKTKKINDLEATYIKSWSNDYYGIIINGYSLSKTKAENDFIKMKEVIPQYLHYDEINPKNNSKVAHIYWSSLIKKIKK